MKTSFDMNLKGYIVKANNGQTIGVCSDRNKIYTKQLNKEIPEIFINFLLSIEDKRFYNHVGIDLIGIIRAFYKNIQAGKIVEGGSTITQQLSRSYLNDNSKTIKRRRSMRNFIEFIAINCLFPKKSLSLQSYH